MSSHEKGNVNGHFVNIFACHLSSSENCHRTDNSDLLNSTWKQHFRYGNTSTGFSKCFELEKKKLRLQNNGVENVKCNKTYGEYFGTFFFSIDIKCLPIYVVVYSAPKTLPKIMNFTVDCSPFCLLIL